jgi:hypothetical protein
MEGKGVIMDNIKASCTWGDGPDILIIFENHPVILHEDAKNDPPPRGQWKHGYVSKGSTDLTQAEARILAAQLICAADACKKIEDSYADWVEHDKAIHNAEVENMHHEKEKTSQQQRVPADKKGESPQAAAENLREHLRKKLLR